MQRILNFFRTLGAILTADMKCPKCGSYQNDEDIRVHIERRGKGFRSTLFCLLTYTAWESSVRTCKACGHQVPTGDKRPLPSSWDAHDKGRLRTL